MPESTTPVSEQETARLSGGGSGAGQLLQHRLDHPLLKDVGLRLPRILIMLEAAPFHQVLYPFSTFLYTFSFIPYFFNFMAKRHRPKKALVGYSNAIIAIFVN